MPLVKVAVTLQMRSCSWIPCLSIQVDDSHPTAELALAPAVCSHLCCHRPLLQWQLHLQSPGRCGLWSLRLFVAAAFSTQSCLILFQWRSGNEAPSCTIQWFNCRIYTYFHSLNVLASLEFIVMHLPRWHELFDTRSYFVGFVEMYENIVRRKKMPEYKLDYSPLLFALPSSFCCLPCSPPIALLLPLLLLFSFHDESWTQNLECAEHCSTMELYSQPHLFFLVVDWMDAAF